MGQNLGKNLWDTLVGHSCRTLWTLFRDTLVAHSCRTLLWVTLTGNSCRKLLWDTLVGHSYRTLLWDTLLEHFCGTLLLLTGDMLRLQVYTSMFRAPQWHGATQTHFPPRPRKSAWHCDITNVISPHGLPHTRSKHIT